MNTSTLFEGLVETRMLHAFTVDPPLDYHMCVMAFLEHAQEYHMRLLMNTLKRGQCEPLMSSNATNCPSPIKQSLKFHLIIES